MKISCFPQQKSFVWPPGKKKNLNSISIFFCKINFEKTQKILALYHNRLSNRGRNPIGGGQIEEYWLCCHHKIAITKFHYLFLRKFKFKLLRNKTFKRCKNILGYQTEKKMIKGKLRFYLLINIWKQLICSSYKLPPQHLWYTEQFIIYFILYYLCNVCNFKALTQNDIKLVPLIYYFI